MQLRKRGLIDVNVTGVAAGQGSSRVSAEDGSALFGKRISVVDPTPFIWHELVTPDQPASGAFFTRLFGWTSRQVDAGPFGTYTLFRSNGRDVAGMMNPTVESPGGGAYWHSYIAVSDVDECARRAPVLGGKVLVAPHDVPEFGRVCAVADPAGAVAHLVQPHPVAT